jgi:hypothetical protein
MEDHQLNNDRKQREKEGCCALVAKPPTEKKPIEKDYTTYSPFISKPF